MTQMRWSPRMLRPRRLQDHLDAWRDSGGQNLARRLHGCVLLRATGKPSLRTSLRQAAVRRRVASCSRSSFPFRDGEEAPRLSLHGAAMLRVGDESDFFSNEPLSSDDETSKGAEGKSTDDDTDTDRDDHRDSDGNDEYESQDDSAVQDGFYPEHDGDIGRARRQARFERLCTFGEEPRYSLSEPRVSTERFQSVLEAAERISTNRIAWYDSVLNLIRSDDQDLGSRDRLWLALRVLQRARARADAEGEPLGIHAHVILSLRKLCEPFRKTNFLLAVKRLLERHGELPTAQVYKGLMRYFVLCDRVQLVRDMLHDMQRVIQTIDANSFTMPMKGFMFLNNKSSAAQIWRQFRAPAFADVEPDLRLLQCGCRLLSWGYLDDVSENALWISMQFYKREIKPRASDLRHLAKARIRVGDFRGARTSLRWLSKKWYIAFDAGLVHDFITKCHELEQWHEIVILVDQVLTHIQRVGGDFDVKLDLLRRCLSELALAAWKSRIDIGRAAALSYRLVEKQRTLDRTMLSHVVYLNALEEGRMVVAMRVAKKNAQKPAARNRTLYAFAYEAIVQKLVLKSVSDKLIKLLPRKGWLAKRPQDTDDFAYIAVNLIMALGQFGLLRIATSIFNAWTMNNESVVNVEVWSAYMYVVAATGQLKPALAIFRELYDHYGTSLDDMPHYLLAVTVLRGSKQGALPTELAAEMLDYIDQHLSKPDAQPKVRLRQAEYDDLFERQVENVTTRDQDGLGPTVMVGPFRPYSSRIRLLAEEIRTILSQQRCAEKAAIQAEVPVSNASVPAALHSPSMSFSDFVSAFEPVPRAQR
ncbi:hypothetical protein FVE85_9802 [Porphyridium purpureum]|uniref:Uncharacterized protein n=1 Tax=Porphyridium purpureum TaxID=35688 RepID=A0A5J4YJ86_PORPP|nr:hypothetical protein FVE85_9802 [Porphyridium purpureum]|eukprot:POR7035..scf289_17